MSRVLAELLVKDKIVSPAQFNEAAAAAAGPAARGMVRYFIEKKIVAETKLLFYLSQKFGLPSINLAKFEIPQDVIKIIPVDIAVKYQIIPIQANKGTLVVALCDPSTASIVQELKFRIKMDVEAVLTSYSAFDAAMAKHYGANARVGEAIAKFEKTAKREQASGDATKAMSIELVQIHDIDHGDKDSESAPVVTLCNGILAEGIRRSASDIHIEPYEKRMRVRMRIDGVLQETIQIPTEMKRAVTARMKIMSRMDIAESRVPQDGRIKLKSGGAEIDFRVNTMPTLYGEKVVMRMLNKGALQLDMLRLGFDEDQLATFRKGITATNGMVLVTGPTGSGKTTTLYSALQELNLISDNLSTVEDPVEYNLEGVNQVQVNKDVGLTFANVLRSLLRQDPDTVLVGEIRDYETAEVAIQAALTGHLVLSTLHTNDSTSTITRLVNMGVEPFLVVASVNTVVAQRLLRTICLACREDHPVPEEKILELGFNERDLDGLKLSRGRGCSACRETGYKGRIAIYEVLDFNQQLKEMILRGESIMNMKRYAVKEGKMKTLRQSALSKAAEGKTSLEEALSLTMEN